MHCFCREEIRSVEQFVQAGLDIVALESSLLKGQGEVALVLGSLLREADKATEKAETVKDKLTEEFKRQRETDYFKWYREEQVGFRRYELLEMKWQGDCES